MSHHITPVATARVLLGLLTSLLLGGVSPRCEALAQTTITHTIGAGDLGTMFTTNGNVHGITGGTTAGNNLFHSFDQFSVGTGDIAQFQTPTLQQNTTLSNILGRVTGGSPSSIYGTIDSATYYPGASLFLMNPAGIVFGPHATLNVGGSFAASTADYLKLPGDVRFNAIPGPSDALLSMASVEAFGFLASNPAAISVQGSTLAVQPGQSISLVGGNQGFTYTNPDTGATATVQGGVTMTGGTLSAPGGQINLVSVASAGEVISNPLGQSQALNVDSFTQLGQIQMSQGARIDASGNFVGTGAGGTVVIRSGRLTLDNSFIQVETLGSVNGASVGVDVQVSSLSLTNGGEISTITSGSAQAGSITLAATDTVTMDGLKSGISNIYQATTESSTSGTPGSLLVTAPTITMTNGAFLGSPLQSIVRLSQRAGDISVQTGSLSISNGAVINTSDLVNGVIGLSPPAGTVTVNATRSITLSGSDASVFGGTGINTVSPFGKSGNITLSTPSLKVDNAVINGSALAGTGGDTELNVGSLEITNGGVIGSIAALGAISTGNVKITATDSVIVTGQGFGPSQIVTFANHGQPGSVSISTPNLTLANGGGIDASTRGPAKGGDLTLNIDKLTMTNGGRISSSSTDTSALAGAAGAITIQGINGPGSSATSMNLDNSTISSTINGGSSTTQSATISITAQTVNLTNGAQINADTSGVAPAGSINITGGNVTLSRGSALTSQSTSADAAAAGAAGQINIAASGILQTSEATVSTSANQGKGSNVRLQAGNDLNFLNGTVLSAQTTGTGTNANGAGDIHLIAGNNLTIRDALVSTKTVSTNASGGSIKLTAPNLVRIVDSALTSSVQGQAGSNGGNIDIDPQLVVIQNSQILANANAGAGGNITITATGAVLVDPNSLLSASAGPAGVSGSVNINSPIQVLSGALVPLKLAYSQAGLSGDRCAADPQGQFSSFVQTGRDGVPQVPGALSPSPLSFLDTVTSGSLELRPRHWAAARLGLDVVRVDDSTLFRFHSACRS